MGQSLIKLLNPLLTLSRRELAVLDRCVNLVRVRRFDGLLQGRQGYAGFLGQLSERLAVAQVLAEDREREMQRLTGRR
ncbi:MAG: hypothetical protein K6V97_15070 [Actinomycetia bacterium]|nr:hypothetical protein [Actinomycetes bacterium]